VVLFVSGRLCGFARDTIGIDKLAEFGQLVSRKLTGLYKMNSKAAGGAIEDAVDKFADHGAGGGVLGDGGRPLVAAAGWFTFYEFLIDHHAEDRRDGGGCDFATLAERLADLAE
jgi:hypothetical protein